MTATRSIFERVRVSLNEQTVRDVLERLGVKKVAPAGPENWKISAPYRRDANPSVSVRRFDGVWNDKSTGQAGDLIGLVELTLNCSPLEAARFIAGVIGVDDPEMTRVRSSSAGVVAEYEYRDETGNLLFVVERRAPKAFRPKRPVPHGWAYGYGDVRRVLYRLPDIIAADPGDEILVVEGEKDADRLREAGFVATTCPGGASSWRPEYVEYLAGRHVVVIPDNDVAGHAFAQRVAESCAGKTASPKVVYLPDLGSCRLKGGLDVSDWLDAGNSVADLKRHIEATPLWTADEVTPVLRVVTLSDVQPERTTWIWYGCIPAAKLTVLDGDPDLGKTTLALDILARLTTGRPMPDGRASDLEGPQNVLLLTAEDGLADTLRPRMQAAGADLSRVKVVTGRITQKGTPDIIGLPRDIPQIEEQIVRDNIKFVLIDPLMAFLDGSINSHNDQSVRQALTPINGRAHRRRRSGHPTFQEVRRIKRQVPWRREHRHHRQRTERPDGRTRSRR